MGRCRALVVVAIGVMLVCTTSVRTAAGRSTRTASSSPSRLLPPPDGQAYFGFTYRLWDSTDPAYGDVRPFAQRIQDSIENELAGKTPTFLTVWSGWQDFPGGNLRPFSASATDIAEVQGVTGAHSLLYLDWSLTSTTAQNGGVTTKDIASGRLDSYIRQYAVALKAYGGPVLMRLFGGEFNGSWWFGVSPLANPSLTPSDFVAAWRRVVDIFRAVGAANVSFAWIPNVYPTTPVTWVDSNIDAYYPGDSYVDWAGADSYDYAPTSWLDPVYAFAVAHDKPFFMAEWGVRHSSSTLTPAEEQAWLGSMFDYFESHPDIKAINYFNYNNRATWDPSTAVYLDGGKVNYMPNVNDLDSRLLSQSGADFQGTYSGRISNLRYTSTIFTQQITAPTISGFTPARGVVGASVLVRGAALSGATSLTVNGVSATFTVQSDTSLGVTVPVGATSGPIVVTTPSGSARSASSFIVVAPPTVAGFSPGSVGVRATVTVSGTNLAATTTVTVNGTSAAFSASSDSRLTFTVPTGATTGLIRITNAAGSATSAAPLSILPPPAITGLSPGSGHVGTTVTITGTNLTGTVGVEIGHVVVVPTSVTPTAVTFTVPAGATTGIVTVLSQAGSAASSTVFTVTS